MRRIFYILLFVVAVACKPTVYLKCDEYPPVFPDYVGVTVPAAISPLSVIMADGRECQLRFDRVVDTVYVTVRAWQKGDRQGVEYKPFPIYINHDEIDPYIAYRLIEPGYESWHDMGIYQREIATFKETAIVTNASNEMGCLNCHSFAQGSPDKMIFHSRGKGGGTFFFQDDVLRLQNLAAIGPQKQGTYPAWHPDGRHLVFSSNNTHQCFPVSGSQPVEVYDTASDIIMMDTATGEISMVRETPQTMETFPCWSPDGKTLYYCEAPANERVAEERGSVRYRLMALDYADGTFGSPRVVLDDPSMSISFPRVSGDILLFTSAAFGTFPIWHAEADLYTLNLKTGEVRPAEELNSPETESYHSFSSNGKWLIFSSRRIDGRYTRLFISHHDGEGNFTKPFLLPQEDPRHNTLRLKSYNVPEFVKGEVSSLDAQVKEFFK